MRRLAMLGALLLAAAPAVAAPVTRALFVGIDDYPPQVDADLKGAVNDVRLMHASLSTTHGLKLDPLPGEGGACEAGGSRSIALFNGCATRAAILDRFDRLVRASAPGDMLIFYFAGHGARSALSDGTQAGGRHSTLVAADSRKPLPGGGVVDDILDVVLKARIDEAAAHGVQVVTIFDSCNSGTATRSAEVASRFVAAAPAGDPTDADSWKPRTPPRGVAYAPRIHLAAARDGEKALEATTPDGRHGRFTRALVEVTAANPGASYGDILQMVRARVQGQVPMGEGPLATTPFLGKPVARDARLLGAEVTADSLLIFDGLLSGVQAGSSFRLHATDADALAGRGPLGLARVVEVSAQGARLVPVPPGLKPGTAVRALEVARGSGDAPLRVRFEGLSPAEVQGALRGLEGVQAVTEAPDLLVVRAGRRLELQDVDGSRLANLSRLSGADDSARAGEGLRRAANATALLRLPHKPSGERLGELKLTDTCAGCRVERAVDNPQGAQVAAGDRFRLLLESTSGKSLYPYLFEVTPQFGISRLYPPGSASDKLAGFGFVHVGEAVRAARPGNFRLVLILSEVPLAAGPLEQGSLPRAGGCEDGHALAKLLCAASRGTRSAEALPAGDFDVVTVPVTIGPPTSKEGSR